MPLTVLTWNAWWAHALAARGRRVAEILSAAGADVIVLTEAEADVLPAGGHFVDAGRDWGYAVQREGRRKVLMWSKEPWRDIDPLGDARMPPGRWIAATTDTELGPIRVVGVCIPWRGAHVTTGQSDRKPWQEHLAYLDALPTALKSQPTPLVIAGDFNQRIPRARQPRDVADALDHALNGLVVATEDGPKRSGLIDHVAHSPDLTARRSAELPGVDADGKLSDHTGVVVTFNR
jgi:endonuclease/exonuclease/phosphatase family metal-dependent hydrolase